MLKLKKTQSIINIISKSYDHKCIVIHIIFEVFFK